MLPITFISNHLKSQQICERKIDVTKTLRRSIDGRRIRHQRSYVIGVPQLDFGKSHFGQTSSKYNVLTSTEFYFRGRNLLQYDPVTVKTRKI